MGCAEDRACAAESVENLITRFDRSPQEFGGIPDKLENGSLEKPDALTGSLEHLIGRFGEFSPLAILDDNGIERDEAFHGLIPWENVEGPKPLGG
jgi:hypothetical protein